MLKEWEPNAATVFGTFVNLVIPGIGDLFCIWQSFQWIEVRRYYQSKPFRNSTCREAKHGNGLWHFCTIFGAFTAKPVRPDDSLEILTEGQKRFLRNNVPDLGPLQQVFYMLFTEKIFPSFLYILLNAILITLWSVITKKPRKVVFDDLPKKRTFFQSIFSRQSHYCNAHTTIIFNLFLWSIYSWEYLQGTFQKNNIFRSCSDIQSFRHCWVTTGIKFP